MLIARLWLSGTFCDRLAIPRPLMLELDPSCALNASCYKGLRFSHASLNASRRAASGVARMKHRTRACSGYKFSAQAVRPYGGRRTHRDPRSMLKRTHELMVGHKVETQVRKGRKCYQ